MYNTLIKYMYTNKKYMIYAGPLIYLKNGHWQVYARRHEKKQKMSAIQIFKEKKCPHFCALLKGRQIVFNVDYFPLMSDVPPVGIVLCNEIVSW